MADQFGVVEMSLLPKAAAAEIKKCQVKNRQDVNGVKELHEMVATQTA